MLNKIKSVMFGHAIGDALGVPVEFCSREQMKRKPVTTMTGYGTYDVPKGCWSDDTSMAMCALESLANGNVDYDEIMKNFMNWYKYGKFTPTGVLFDIGRTCLMAIENYMRGCKPEDCGLSDVRSNGNGSLMRIHPFVLYAYYNGIDGDEFEKLIAYASALTHGHYCSIDGCIIYAYVLIELIKNPCKKAIYDGISKAKNAIAQCDNYYHRLYSNVPIEDLHESQIKSSGYVVDSLEASLWCLLTTNNYQECVLKAVNLGEDTDTVAAIAGGLAGALYGVDSIPNEWMSNLKKRNYIEQICEDACNTWRKIEV